MTTDTETGSTPSTSDEMPTPSALPCEKPLEIIDVNNLSFDLSILTESMIHEFDLRTLLTTSALGKSVLKFYDTYRMLNGTQQNRLVDIIVKHIYNYIIRSPLTHGDYNKIVSKIINLFPNENMGTYYVPPILKADHPAGRSQRSMGKLPNRVRNIRFLSGDTKKRKTDQHVESDVEGNNTKRIRLDDTNIDNDIKEDWLWLRTNSEPWAVVVEKWQKTYHYRKSSGKGTVTEFYEDWPILNDLRANALINLDFEKQYPEHHLNFHLHWKKFIDELILKRGNQLRDPYAIELKESLTEGDNIPTELILLNYIVPPTGKIKTGKKIWKFSTLESIEGIFLHVKDPGSINLAIQNKTEVAYQKGRRVQPYIVFVGPSLSEISHNYVVVDNIKYKCESSVQAVDTLFKLFHVCNIHYPPESEHIYLIIQKAIYKINTNFDKQIPSIMEIVSS
ncbi:uncharacterized protein LOC116164711 [Photinus pyralis]|uniref:uncharacterized protein LOC116164711 n=1 Tax=Photinus pyralis TaxID=7054 RepID=UPI00126780C5|nr:uncharacterized protein LOC116164711 [Photinus pyralis]